MAGLRIAAALAGLVLAAAVSGCGRSGDPAGLSPLGRAADAINSTTFVEKAGSAAGPYDPAILRIQVLLDRARFSPGVIDGHAGENLERALKAYAQANGLDADGKLTTALWNRLTRADPRPVVRSYVIDADDVAGPFSARIPPDFAAQADLDQLGYGTPAEELAESFHMDPALLEALNPGADFRPGSTVLVAVPGGDDLGEDVSKIEVDSAAGIVRAFGANGRLLAAYPATVGSRSQPAPTGPMLVEAVQAAPSYNYVSDKVTQAGAIRLRNEIAPGPNNPIGVVWIALSDDRYGLHGGPDPGEVGKAAEHGWVRMTNWDARELARGVTQGVLVMFK